MKWNATVGSRNGGVNHSITNQNNSSRVGNHAFASTYTQPQKRQRKDTAPSNTNRSRSSGHAHWNADKQYTNNRAQNGVLTTVDIKKQASSNINSSCYKEREKKEDDYPIGMYYILRTFQ